MLADCMSADDNESSMKAAEQCEHLMAVVSKISADEKVSKWLQERPPTKF